MFKRSLLIALIAAVSSFAWVYLHYPHSTSNLISPIIQKTNLSLAENIWLPKLIPSALADTTAPEVTAKAAFFIDINTGQVLFEKNENDRLPIASLTKIMTVIVTLENKSWDNTYTISDTAANMEPDHMELIAGEKLTAEELLDGVFTVSANDAAEALAEGSVNSRDEFINLMNQKAKQIGMNNTLFINPTGLEEDNKNQYSSAFDVALMSRYAIVHWPHLIDISDKPQIYLPATSAHQDYTLNSGINLLTTYPGVIGFKTGYTPNAGLTLVTLAKRDNHQVLGVILNSDDRRGEARELLDYSFKKLGVLN